MWPCSSLEMIMDKKYLILSSFSFLIYKMRLRDKKMAHRIEVIAANRDNLSLIPGALMEERKKNMIPQVFLFHIYAWHTFSSMHMVSTHPQTQ